MEGKVSPEVEAEKHFEDIENFIRFLDECLGLDFFIVRPENCKNEDEQTEDDPEYSEDYRVEKEKHKRGIFDRIVSMHMEFGDPYILMKEEKKKLLEDISSRILSCKLCELHKERKNAVPGEGDPMAQVVFVGEAPGYEEDKKGRPFVGRSGVLLTSKIKEFIGLDRADVFITNVVRCRPPQNRTPDKVEMEKCTPYLFEEIDVIDPRLVVALGAPAAKVLLMRDEKITEMRGNFYRRGNYTVFVTFHPAYVLRNPSVIELFNEDFRKIAEFLRSG